MVSGCFSYYRVEKLKFIDVKMNAPHYVNLLSRSLLSSVQKMKISNFIFMQDNDPKHNSRLAKEFFREKNIGILLWSAHSPDYNPIENFLGIIKSKNESKVEIMVYWSEIPVETCQKLVLSYKKRACKVYRAKRDHIYK